MTARELLSKIALGEDSSLELKQVRIEGDKIVAPRRDSLADELSAMANGRGGLVVLGVEDATRALLGIPRERLDAVEALVRELCNDSIDLPLVAHILKQELPGADGVAVAVLLVEVPRGLFVHQSPGGFFVRVGSSKRRMSTEYLARLFQQRSQARLIRFHEQAIADATLDALSQPLWERFRTPRSAGEPRETLLEKLRMAREGDDGAVHPSVAGALLATLDPRLWLPNAYIQAVAYKGTSISPDEGRTPYQLDAADLTGPIDQQVVDALRFVARNMKVAAFKHIGRRDVPQFDLGAVFEALVNAVAHRDYAVHGAKIRLRVFADWLELMSPGALANTMTLESLPFGQAARNEVLASLLARCPIPANAPAFETTREHLMDKRGEGVSIILERSERLSGRRPEYRVVDDMEVQLTIWAADPDAASATETEETR